MISSEQAIAKLKTYWNTKELKCYAEFHRPKLNDGKIIKPKGGGTSYGYFRNLSINDHKILYPPNTIFSYQAGIQNGIEFKVNVVDGLEDGKYYLLELELDDDENRKENPYKLKIKEFSRDEDYISPKEFIKQWFYKKGHTPEDAATIAGQLTLNELELYTHTKRFIFELIQNADDMPFGKNDVNIEIHLLPNHLLFLHNGKYFDREDVKTISDAAKSTKSKSLSQTGYKGIGFKSVFTDSTRVYIKSIDYFFKFDKLEPIFQNFHLLYKGYSDSLTLKAKKEFEAEFKGKEEEYINIDKIPWQIKPIWVEPNTIPQELSSSHFIKNQRVSIALEIGENILRQKDYHGMILGLLKEPRFLLFLRNTKDFKFKVYTDSSTVSVKDVSVKEKNNITSVYSNGEIIASYIKHEFTININNEDFKKAGLNFQKREIEGGKIEFFDNESRKLENIPEKLGRLDKTIITLSAKIEKYGIEKLEKEDSILFNYLPTSDQRFGFPFLVNADFVSKTDREFIQIENKWNHYLFYHLGQKCIEWVANLGKRTHVIEGKHLFLYDKTYLNLLPEDLLDEHNEELASINIAFNKGLLDAVQGTRFIIDYSGNFKRCEDIIIDDTSISKVLGNSFFKNVSKSKKELPFLQLDLKSLKKDYLNIERYKAENLIKELSDGSNKLELTKTLIRLNPEEYLEFLTWLDNFCNINDIDNDWLLNLPIIRLNESVISLKDALIKSDFYLRISKTKELENILQKVGFSLSEFCIDDEIYKHIKGVVLQQDLYFKTDVKLYEHIARAKDLGKLTAIEKNTLITFFESLDDVGKAKYAKSLALFKSKKENGSLKPLTSLISNSCQDLPVWLTDFTINKQDENALAEPFKKHLLKQSDLLEKLFCNPTTFNEIISGINAENINDFYAYLLKLLKDKPKETKIDFSSIPWLYIEATTTFALPSTVYWPESITKLSAPKYAHVKTILEAISTEQLPHFAALQIKAPFALGGKDVKLIDILTKEGSFEVLPLNDFLDWAEANGEKEFLAHFSISKINEKQTIVKAIGTLHYYTKDESLIAFIEASVLKSKMNLFPQELYTQERNKIGLLEGVNLLKYLLDNGQAMPSFVKFIQVVNNAALSLQYLELIDEINIETTKNYTSESDEFKILKLLVQHIVGDDAKLENFRNKVMLNGKQLIEMAISADIIMYQADKLIYEFQNIELSDVLPAYKGKTYSVSDIVELFIDFRDSGNLKKVFKAKGRGAKRIYDELSALASEYYNPAQTFFLSYFKYLHPSEYVFKNKVLFSNANSDNSIKFEKEVHEFLDISLMESRYIGFLPQEIISNFNPAQIILSEDYAVDSEKPPKWISDWLNVCDTENKKAFLMQLGINDESSPIVLFRKAIQESDLVAIGKNIGLIENDELLINTLEWLSNKKKQNGFIIKKEILQTLYQRLSIKKVPIDNLLLACLEKYQVDSYSLETLKEGDELHYIHDGWGEYKQEIFSHLVSPKKITDDVVPKLYRDAWKMIDEPFLKLADTENLTANSYPFDEEYYQEWELKSKYNIQIYKGTKLPYVIKYNDLLINSVTDRYADCIDEIYYVVESKKESILFYLDGILVESALNALKLHKQNLIEKEADRKIQFTEEEFAVWKKLFGNEIPEEYYLDINLAACVSALVMLNKNGYDVSKADSNLFSSHGFAQVEPVFKGESSEPLTIMCRSAIGGILYLTAQAWDRLEKKEIHLFVKTGNKENNYHFFLNKKEVLEISDTKYQVFRVEAESSSSTTDEILKGEFAKDKIWLILKMKDNETYKSIFEGKSRNEENPDYENLNTAENSQY